MDEIHSSVEQGYLSLVQYQIVEARLNHHLTYDQLISQFGLSGRTALTHALVRTCSLEYWSPSMKGRGKTYISQHDLDIFFKIIGDASDESNCIPSMYAISLSHYIKKKRFNRANTLLNFINCPELALNFTSTNPPSKTWLYNVIKNSNLNLIAGIVAMFQLYIFIWNYMGICSTETLD